MRLVFANVLLDVVTNDVRWVDWSVGQLDIAAVKGALAVKDVICAEFSVRFARIEALDAVLKEAGLTVAAMPRSALFLAGKAFQRYRAAGGVRTGVLLDFFIGARRRRWFDASYP